VNSREKQDGATIVAEAVRRYTLRAVSAETEYVSRAEQARRTREGIVETALHLFAERGYDGTSLQQIADAMGLTKAAVYYHFRSKADIAHAIVHPSFEAFSEVIERAAEGRSRAQRIEVVVTGVVDLLIRHRGRLSIIQSDPAMEHEVDRDASRFDGLMDRAVEVIYGPEASIEERVSVYMAAGIGKSFIRMRGVTDEELREALTRACTRLLRVR